MAQFKTETRYQEGNGNAVEYLSYGLETPDQQAQINTAYGFFETEAEAAQAFLDEISEHPKARYSQSRYQAAIEAVRK
jgi:hypothetical protein